MLLDGPGRFAEICSNPVKVSAGTLNAGLSSPDGVIFRTLPLVKFPDTFDQTGLLTTFDPNGKSLSQFQTLEASTNERRSNYESYNKNRCCWIYRSNWLAFLFGQFIQLGSSSYHPATVRNTSLLCHGSDITGIVKRIFN